MNKQDSLAHEFVMGFVAVSDRYKKPFVERQREVLANFILEPTRQGEREFSPYSHDRTSVYRSRRNRIVLKDSETHKAIMTYASKLVRALLSERDGGYVQCRPIGEEDALFKSPTVNRLLRYALRRPGVFRTFVEAVVDMLLFGTSLIEVAWKYEERQMPVRSMTSEMGVELSEFSTYAVPVYDDVALTTVDIADFYPDPSQYRLQNMSGAAKRFKMNRMAAMGHADYDKTAVEQAYRSGGSQDTDNETDNFRRGLDQPLDQRGHPELVDRIGYEYQGLVPWEDNEGNNRRVITIINNVVVRNKPWDIADSSLPWHSLIINPMQGRFFGVAPGEVMRYDQDFADALKILLAEAVIRQVHPPIAYDPDAGIDLAKVREWRADALIPTRGGLNSVGALRYDANISAAFNLMASLQASMQGAGGALGAIQGQDGPDREAASVGVQRMNNAMDRPELAAMVLERECLPPIGLSILRRYQQFLGGTDELKMRIGELPESVWLGDIMGDFDVEFVGSRVAMSKQEKLQAWDRMAAMATAIPELRMLIPWGDIGKELVSTLLELPEIAARMPDPKAVMQNALMAKIAGMGGAGKNGVAQASPPAGMMPEQAMGEVVS